MEQGMIAIAAVLTSIVVMPFILLMNSSQKHKNQLKNGLKHLAAAHNASLSRLTLYLSFAIGIEEITRQIYFFKKTGSSKVCKTVDLNLGSTCSISNQSKSIRIEKRSQEIIEKVALVFEFKNNAPPERFELFDDTENLQLYVELAIAQEWENTVSTLLTNEIAAIVIPEHRSRILDLSKIAVL
jgi:hypothetical protein